MTARAIIRHLLIKTLTVAVVHVAIRIDTRLTSATREVADLTIAPPAAIAAADPTIALPVAAVAVALTTVPHGAVVAEATLHHREAILAAVAASAPVAVALAAAVLSAAVGVAAAAVVDLLAPVAVADNDSDTVKTPNNETLIALHSP